MFRNDTKFIKLLLNQIVSPRGLWMDFEAGEGEEEIRNHGWSRVKSFSQETRFKSQLSPRIGGKGAKSCLVGNMKSQVQDAHDSLTQLPFFFLSQEGEQS